MWVLSQFLFRLAFGLALGMAVTSSRQVTSGYFRNHAYVLLGLNTLAALVAASVAGFALAPPLAGAIVSYVASVLWLYEKPAAGKIGLWIVAGLAIWGAWQVGPAEPPPTFAAQVLAWLDPVAGGLVLGITMAAMLLGHWYLNSPTMQLAPLKRLLVLMAGALFLRTALAGAGLVVEGTLAGSLLFDQRLLFVVLRWLSGLLGTLGMVWMTWLTLKVPNTQSATGILYVCVITTFLGELTALLL